MKKLLILFSFFLAFLIPPLQAADLTFPTYVPQDTDSTLTLQQRQAAALAALQAAGGGGGAVGAQRTPTIVPHTTSGSVALGCRSLVFIASSDYAGTILTNFPLPAGAGLTVPIPAGDTLAAVAYTVSAGTLYSVEVR